MLCIAVEPAKSKCSFVSVDRASKSIPFVVTDFTQSAEHDDKPCSARLIRDAEPVGEFDLSKMDLVVIGGSGLKYRW